MRFSCFALLCIAGCTQAGSASTSSGNETVMESEMGSDTVVSTVETPSDNEEEIASALGDPPPAEPAVAATPATPPATEAPTTPPATEPTQPAPTVRPTTILAPARSGRVRLPAVHDVIRDHRPEVTQCYQEGLSRNRSLAGVAKVRFLIGPRGRIENAEVYESSLHDDTVEECILAAMREWRFPRPRPRGSSVLMTYPYSLATE